MRCNMRLWLPQEKQMFYHLELLESAKAEWECFTVKNTDCWSHFKGPYVCGNSRKDPSLLLWHCRHSVLIKIHLVETHVGTRLEPASHSCGFRVVPSLSAGLVCLINKCHQSCAGNSVTKLLQRIEILSAKQSKLHEKSYYWHKRESCVWNEWKTFTIQRHACTCTLWSSVLMCWII